jgi:hypothetical protein
MRSTYHTNRPNFSHFGTGLSTIMPGRTARADVSEIRAVGITRMNISGARALKFLDTARGRFAEVFAYDHPRRMFSLEDRG